MSYYAKVELFLTTAAAKYNTARLYQKVESVSEKEFEAATNEPVIVVIPTGQGLKWYTIPKFVTMNNAAKAEELKDL